MADKKISELNAASTLVGTELLPVVQDGDTRKIAISDLQSQFSIPSVAATLHRSPNAITSLFIYDTSKDSDGGAWTEKCQHTSWYQETIYGKWLGAQASEAAARAVTGATTDDYFQLTTDGKFYKLNASNGTTEVFRGNKRAFPKVAAIVAEKVAGATTQTAYITIYDLTEQGRPMWMRISSDTAYGLLPRGSNYGYYLGYVDISALNGVMVFSNSDSGLRVVKWAADKGGNVAFVFKGNIAQRHQNLGYDNPYSPALDSYAPWAYSSTTPRAVSLAVLANAPIDPMTGLPRVTVAAATSGVYLSDGVKGTNSATTSLFTQVTLTNKLLSAGRDDTTWYYAANPGSLGASFTLSTKNASTATDFNVGNTTLLKAKDRKDLIRSSGAVVQRLRNNESTINKGLSTKLSDTYNTGWLAGDIRRCFLANSLTADRSYKAATAAVTGTLTSTAVNTGNDLVAYSGFSGSNYLQEPYSADLDFGTGEWSAGAWVNAPVTFPSDSSFPVSPTELITNGGSGFSDTSGWSSASQGTISVSGGAATFTTLAGDTLGGAARAFTTVSGSRYRITIDCQSLPVSGSGRVGVGTVVNNSDWFNSVGAVNITTTGVTTLYFTAQGTSAYINVYAVSGNTSANQSLVLNSVSVKQLMPLQIASRAHATGPYITLGIDATNKLTATAYDGTTTRTVTSSAAYNTATWLKADATYTTDGALKLWVNGVNVATTTGTPLLTLNNSNAVLTIGNSYALDAPFPGSIALLKLSATVPTAEQAAFMYEQEKHLFSAGAKCVLPASTNVLDLAYDDRTDTWSTLQATYESSFSGLVRTSTQAQSAGSFSKSAAGSGIKLLARTTTNPGVDVQMPKRNLKEDRLADLVDDNIVVFDFDAVTSQTDFALPMGYTAKVVYSAGAQKREGSTKDWTRLFDGFFETIRFGTAPGNGVWVQIHAVKEVV